MSTIFAIIPVGKEPIEVAFRDSSGIYWRNELAEYLDDKTKVEPLDNTAQGIYTIGDIRKEIKAMK